MAESMLQKLEDPLVQRMVQLSEDLATCRRRLKLAEKEQRKLQDRLNRFSKLVPGSRRIWDLDRMAIELDLLAEDWEEGTEERASYEADALAMRRLAWDLHEIRDAVRGPRPSDAPLGSRYNVPRGPRP